jgi:hypothetical protein
LRLRVESNTPSGCHNLGSLTFGDVDRNGDVIERFRQSVGEFIADDVDAEDQARLALQLLAKAPLGRVG